MTNTQKILEDIIAIPSFVDGDNNETGMIHYVENFLSQHTSLILEKQLVEGNRYNLLAKGNQNPKIILFGHLDTVLPKNETKDPFVPKTEGDKLFGLGSVDMKSGLAIMLDIASKNLSEELGFVFSVDEEYDFKGAKKLMEIDTFHPQTIINVEPTNQKILNGCRGITEFSFNLIGKSAHAGKKQLGINAIESVLALSRFLEQELAKFDTEDIKSSVNLAFLHGGILDSFKDEEPVIKRMGNVVPDFAQAVIEIRLGTSQITKSYLTNLLEEKTKEQNTRLENLKFKFFLGSMFTPKSKLVSFEKVLHDSGQKVEYSDINQTGFFELQMLQEKWGGDCFVFGAGPSEMSHCANEYVSLSSLVSVQNILEKYLAQELPKKNN